ncbi:MAG TPA: GGDEF domain-containing protein [Candidatus Goldiibacteriota bacterium]|nr:GGDEF domain-containing protein [Candidatus Goldiibacteriota bacterium]HPI04321.1 GGDEF domain-containing protein [Candidatus Goldiibacteriota bacterium]HRQ43202.1 GGDEF domain-containing protein [Candidatus Goldiibacteriota bacterium]
MADDGGVKKTEELQEELDVLKKENEELKLLYETIVKHATSLENDLEKKLREITVMSVTDSLTNIFNRRKFTDSLLSEVSKALKNGTALSLVIFDIDNFKQINDKYGHDYGDFVLVTSVSIIKKVLLNNSVFARWGGDEFTILMPGIDAQQAVKIAQAAREELHNHYLNIHREVSCSFGVTELLKEDSVKSFIVRADNALYEAKNSGRNSVKNL